ncbi:MAG: hypothetical protein C0483_17100 [Pirellula sp.]|nr:hypothetical protein [Pirellula sp.]
MASSQSCEEHSQFRSSISRYVWLVALIAYSGNLSNVASGATYTWTNTTGNWSSDPLWGGSHVTGTDPADILIFGGTGTTQYRATNDILPGGVAGPFKLNQLHLNSSASVTEYLFGNALQFDNAGSKITIANTGGFAINNKLILNTGVTVDSSGTTTAAAGITFGRLGMAGALSGSGLLTLNSSRTTPLYTLFGNNTDFSGGVTLTTGTLAIGERNALGTGTLTLAGGTTVRAASGSTGTIGNTVLLNGNVTFSGQAAVLGSLDFGGSFRLQNAARTLTVSTSEVLISGVIDDGAGALKGSIVKAGTAALILGGANTYTGGTTINASSGTLRVTASGRLGANVSGNDIVLGAGSFLRLASPSNIGNLQKLTVNGTAANYAVLGLGFDALPSTLGSSGIVSTTPNVLAVDGIRYTQTIDLAGLGGGDWSLGATNANGVFAGTLLPGNGSVYRLGGGGGVLRVVASNALSDSAASLQVGVGGVTNGGGTVILEAAQSYGGGTTVSAGATLIALTNAALGSGNNITLSGGTLDLRVSNVFGAVATNYALRNITTTANSTMVFGSYNGGVTPTITVGSLTFGSGTSLTVNPSFNGTQGNPQLRFGGSTMLNGNNTITVNTGAGVALDGSIDGTGSLTKAGAGRLILSSANSFNGDVTLSAGLLTLADPSALSSGSLTLSGGELELRSDGTGSGQTIPFNITGAGGLTITASSAINVDRLSYGGTSFNNTIEISAPTNLNAAGLTLTVNSASGTSDNSLQGANPLGIFAGTGYRLKLSGPMSLANAGVATFTFSTISAPLEISGNITETGSGAKSLSKSGRNNLILSGTNNYTGSTAVTRGALFVMNNGALGSTTGITLADATAGTLAITWNTDLFAGPGITVTAPITVGTITGSTTGGSAAMGTLVAGASSFSGNVTVTRNLVQLMAFDAASTVNFTGVISNTGGVTKLGSGLVVLNPSAGTGNTFSGAVTVAAGRLRGVVPTTSGSPFGTGTSLTVSGGSLELEGISTAKTISGQSLTTGGGRLVLDATAGGVTNWTFNSVARTGSGTLTVVPFSGQLDSKEIFTFTGATTTNSILSPWIAAQISGANSSGDFLKLSGSQLNVADYSGLLDINSAVNTTVFSATSSTTNALVLDGLTFALKVDNATISGPGLTLTVGNDSATIPGGIILNNNASITTGRLAFGASEGAIYVGGASTGTAVGTISSALSTTNANGITKFGPGTLILSGASLYTAPTNVNEGTLQASAANVLAGGLVGNALTGSIYNVAAGATLDIAGFNQRIGGLSGDGKVLLGTGSLTAGLNGSTNTTFNGTIIGGVGSKFVKNGSGTLTISGGYQGAPAIDVDELVVERGVLLMNVRDPSWHGPLPGGPAIPESTKITLRGGTLELRNGSDVGNINQNIAFRNNVTVTASSTLSLARIENDGSGSKDLLLGNLTIGNQSLTSGSSVGGGLHSLLFGNTTLIGSAIFNASSNALGLQGTISDGNAGYTINKLGANSMYLGGDSLSTFSGGVVVNAGTLQYGFRVGITNIPSATANAGTGHVLLNPTTTNTAVRLASAANLATGSRLFVYSTPSSISRVELWADLDFATIPISSTGRGTLSMSTQFWTTPLDMARYGDGSWYLGAFQFVDEGSTSNTIQPYTTLYTATTLGVGKDNTYRFGGSNAGSSGAGGIGVVAVQEANVLTGGAAVVVGAPLSVVSSTGSPVTPSSTTGTLQLNSSQNYTGNTVVYRGGLNQLLLSTLDFRGTLASPTIEVEGILAAVGAGRFSDDGLTNLNTVVLRPGSTLRLDYGIAQSVWGFTPVLSTTPQSATGFTNKWGDAVPLFLNGATLDLVSGSSLVTTEYINQLQLAGGADLRIRSLGTNGQMQLMLGSALSRSGLATLSVETTVAGGLGGAAATGQIGRLFFTNIVDAPARGLVGSTTVNMVAPWIVNGIDNSFVDYDPILGLRNAAFAANNTSATFNAGSNNGTDIIDGTFNVNTTTTQTNTGTSSIYALRLGNNSTTTTTVSLTGGTINIFGGGLITQISSQPQSIGISSNLYFGNGSTPVEAAIYTSNATTTAVAQNTTTLSGGVTSSGLSKGGAGTLILSGTNAIGGTIQVNNGILQLNGLPAMGGASSLVIGGANSSFNSVLTAANTPFATLSLRSDTPVSFAPITVLEGTPYLTLTLGSVSSGSGVVISIPSLTLNTGNVAGGQILNFSSSSSYIGTVTGATTINGGGSLVLNAAATLNLNGTVSGIGAKIVKQGVGLVNLAVANTFSGGVEVQSGTLQLRTSTSQGSGDVTLGGGTITLINAASTTFFTGSNLTVTGSSTLSLDRNGAAGATTFTIGATGSNKALTLVDGLFTVSSTTTLNSLVVSVPTVLAGNPGISSSSNSPLVRFDSPISGGGQSLTKTGPGRVGFSDVNTFDGTLSVLDGIVQAQNATARFTGVGGKVEVLPGGSVIASGLNSFANSGGITRLVSTAVGTASLGVNFVPASQSDYATLLPASGVTSLVGNGGALLIEITGYNQPLNMSTLYNGDWWLGTTLTSTTPSITSTLTAGLNNSYRFGGGNGNFILSAANLLTGANRVLYGKPNAVNTITQPILSGNYNYSLGTTIARGSIVFARSGNANTPFGTAAVDVFGTLEWDGVAGSAVSGLVGAGGSSANSNVVTLHPGSILRFDNLQPGNFNSGTATGGRWADAAPIALNGATVTLLGSGTAVTTEVVGALSYTRGSTVIVTRGTAALSATLDFSSLTRNAGGTLTISTTAAALGAATNFERVLFSGIAPTLTSNMLSPSIVGQTENVYLTYDSTLGLKAIDTTVANTFYTAITNGAFTGITGGTKVIDITTTAATLSGNPDIYALRTNQNVNNSSGGIFSQITIRSGGFLGYANTTVAPDLLFAADGSTPSEGLMYSGSGFTTTINGKIRASSLVKFGAGTLILNVDQTNMTGNWVVNSGTLTVATPGALGSSGSEVTLNGGAAGGPVLNFVYDVGTIDVMSFVSGKITAWDNNTIQFGAATTTTDRTAAIADIDLKSTAGSPGGETTGNRILFNILGSRNTLTTGTVTLYDDYMVNVDGGTTTFTLGSSGNVVFDELNNQGTPLFNAGLTKTGDGTLTLRDNGTSFVNGKIVVAQGTLRVTANGSLGDATSAATIDYGGALDVAASNFAPLGSLTFRPGSIERWSVENARNPTSTYTVDPGVTLQLNTSLTTARTIILNGGGVQGFLRADDDATVVFRKAGAGINWVLSADSFVGTAGPLYTVTAGALTDPGKTQPFGVPYNTTIVGAVLELQGSISESGGARSLTKLGPELVILSGTNTYSGGTFVREGTLQLGSSNSMPSSSFLWTTAGSMFDVNGYNATAAYLQGAGGSIVNGNPTMSTLTFGNGVSSTYAGQISGPLSLSKVGAGVQTLSGIASHLGSTSVLSGGLTIAPTGAVQNVGGIVVAGSATLNVQGSVSGSGTVSTAGVVNVSGALNTTTTVTVLGGGSLTGAGGTVSGAVSVQNAGILAPGDGGANPYNGIGQLNISGSGNVLTLQGGSQIYFEYQDPLGSNPGTNWDLINLTSSGNLLVQATAASPITLHLGVTGGGGFDAGTSYSWKFLQAAGISTTGPDLIGDRFLVETGAMFGSGAPFEGQMVGGTFYVSQLNNDLYLNYAYESVPEPGSLMLCTLAGAAGYLRRRFQRRRQTSLLKSCA